MTFVPCYEDGLRCFGHFQERKIVRILKGSLQRRRGDRLAKKSDEAQNLINIGSIEAEFRSV